MLKFDSSQIKFAIMTVQRKINGCTQCAVKHQCMTSCLTADELQKFEQRMDSKIKLKRGDSLFYQGDPFNTLFAVRVGVMKTSISRSNGQEQVTGFQMYGEILGLDGIESQSHACHAVALEDAEICAIPYRMINDLSEEVPKLHQRLAELMSTQLVQNNRLMLLLGSMCANERVAIFLMNMMERQRARGLSTTELMLRMTRQDIASYLGLQLETVSRKFSRMSDVGLISVNRKYIRVTDLDRLKHMASTW
jgi:CRP/FNR family transcriptional regulator